MTAFSAFLAGYFGLADAAGLALAPGVGVGLVNETMLAVSGVSITPKVSLIGRLLRYLVAVQRSAVIPPARIRDRPEVLSFTHRFDPARWKARAGEEKGDSQQPRTGEVMESWTIQRVVPWLSAMRR